MQNFKGDPTELKVIAAGEPVFETVGDQKDIMFEECYEAAPLGDVIYDTDRSPLSNAIVKEIFRTSFKEIFDAFVQSGNFESYITVFTKIFGDEADITFTVPAPGKLQILIEADEIELSDMLARNIVDNAYLFDEIIDDEGDNIVLQTIKGFQSQYELEQMLFELVPAGIFTEITLELGA